MKLRKKNITKKFAESVILKRYVLVLFITHLLVVHFVLQNYVVCFENDGSIVLENAAEKEYCCNTKTLSQDNLEMIETNAEEDCSLCRDVSVSENCNEETYLTVSKIKLSTEFVPLSSYNDSYSAHNFQTNNFICKNEINTSPQLDSHKTVLLLI